MIRGRVTPTEFPAMIWLGEAWLGLKLAARLPGFLRHPLRIGEARAIVRERLAGREASFLDLLRRAVYGRPDSPYRALVLAAGCEFGDVERLVHAEGVEGALRSLYRAGVYLTVDEFKARQPIVRSGRPVTGNPDALRNPLAGAHVASRTSGSRGAPRPVPADLAFLRDRAVNSLIVLAARGGLIWERPGTSRARTSWSRSSA